VSAIIGAAEMDGETPYDEFEDPYYGDLLQQALAVDLPSCSSIVEDLADALEWAPMSVPKGDAGSQKGAHIEALQEESVDRTRSAGRPEHDSSAISVDHALPEARDLPSTSRPARSNGHAEQEISATVAEKESDEEEEERRIQKLAREVSRAWKAKRAEERRRLEFFEECDKVAEQRRAWHAQVDKLAEEIKKGKVEIETASPAHAVHHGSLRLREPCELGTKEDLERLERSPARGEMWKEYMDQIKCEFEENLQAIVDRHKDLFGREKRADAALPAHLDRERSAIESFPRKVDLNARRQVAPSDCGGGLDTMDELKRIMGRHKQEFEDASRHWNRVGGGRERRSADANA
jgi:hypothetical protein